MKDTWEFLRLKIFRCLKPEIQSPCQKTKSVRSVAVSGARSTSQPRFARLPLAPSPAPSPSPAFGGLGKDGFAAFFFIAPGLSIWAISISSSCCITLLYVLFSFEKKTRRKEKKSSEILKKIHEAHVGRSCRLCQ